MRRSERVEHSNNSQKRSNLMSQIGASACGKSTVVRLLAALTGQKLRSIAVNTAMDTTEILGGFEQVGGQRETDNLIFLRPALCIFKNHMSLCSCFYFRKKT